MFASPLYQSQHFYEAVMKTLYGAVGYRDRFEAVAGYVQPGDRVLDLCCGPARLYDFVSRVPNAQYMGYDASSQFINAARNRKIPAEIHDLRKDKIPAQYFDVIVLMSSLYQFIPHEESLIERLVSLTRRKVIICEPVQNISHSSSGIVKTFCRWFTTPGVGERSYSGNRFSEQMLETLFSKFRPIVEIKESVGNMREVLYVLNKSPDNGVTDGNK